MSAKTREELIELLKLIAPDLGTAYTDDELDTFISLAETQIGPAVWGDLYDQGLVYLAAHTAAVSDRTGSAGGPIQSEKAGAVSRSYATSSNQVSEYDQTKYGKKFKKLQSQVVGTKPLTTLDDSQWIGHE
jgi:hypothetical protein